MFARYVPRAVSLPILVYGKHLQGSPGEARHRSFFGIVLLSDIRYVALVRYQDSHTIAWA